jgi:hypothetical protein
MGKRPSAKRRVTIAKGGRAGRAGAEHRAAGARLVPGQALGSRLTARLGASFDEPGELAKSRRLLTLLVRDYPKTLLLTPEERSPPAHGFPEALGQGGIVERLDDMSIEARTPDPFSVCRTGGR